MAIADPLPAPPSGYCPPPPDAADLIALPADFGARFAVFVDTEEEFDWNAPLRREARGTSATAALPKAHRWFAARGVPLTFMIDHPIVSDRRSVDILREIVADRQSAIGTQLHPWVNPPFDEIVSGYNSFPGNLPEVLEAAKIDVLTDAITVAFGAAPRAFRAGRYGIGPRTLRLLAARGYVLDSSMRSRYSYVGEGGPDFRDIGNAPFRRAGLIELPLTTVFTGTLRGRGQGLYDAIGRLPRGRGLFARTGLLARVALTPEEMPVADVLEALRAAHGDGVRLFNFAFHSPSLEPGHTPYVRDAAELAAFYDWWERVLALLDRLGVRSIALDPLIAALGG